MINYDTGKLLPEWFVEKPLPAILVQLFDAALARDVADTLDIVRRGGLITSDDIGQLRLQEYGASELSVLSLLQNSNVCGVEPIVPAFPEDPGPVADPRLPTGIRPIALPQYKATVETVIANQFGYVDIGLDSPGPAAGPSPWAVILVDFTDVRNDSRIESVESKPVRFGTSPNAPYNAQLYVNGYQRVVEDYPETSTFLVRDIIREVDAGRPIVAIRVRTSFPLTFSKWFPDFESAQRFIEAPADSPVLAAASLTGLNSGSKADVIDDASYDILSNLEPYSSFVQPISNSNAWTEATPGTEDNDTRRFRYAHTDGRVSEYRLRWRDATLSDILGFSAHNETTAVYKLVDSSQPAKYRLISHPDGNEPGVIQPLEYENHKIESIVVTAPSELLDGVVNVNIKPPEAVTTFKLDIHSANWAFKVTADGDQSKIDLWNALGDVGASNNGDTVNFVTRMTPRTFDPGDERKYVFDVVVPPLDSLGTVRSIQLDGFIQRENGTGGFGNITVRGLDDSLLAGDDPSFVEGNVLRFQAIDTDVIKLSEVNPGAPTQAEIDQYNEDLDNYNAAVESKATYDQCIVATSQPGAAEARRAARLLAISRLTDSFSKIKGQKKALQLILRLLGLTGEIIEYDDVLRGTASLPGFVNLEPGEVVVIGNVDPDIASTLVEVTGKSAEQVLQELIDLFAWAHMRFAGILITETFFPGLDLSFTHDLDHVELEQTIYMDWCDVIVLPQYAINPLTGAVVDGNAIGTRVRIDAFRGGFMYHQLHVGLGCTDVDGNQQTGWSIGDPGLVVGGLLACKVEDMNGVNTTADPLFLEECSGAGSQWNIGDDGYVVGGFCPDLACIGTSVQVVEG